MEEIWENDIQIHSWCIQVPVPTKLAYLLYLQLIFSLVAKKFRIIFVVYL